MFVGKYKAFYSKKDIYTNVVITLKYKYIIFK